MKYLCAAARKAASFCTYQVLATYLPCRRTNLFCFFQLRIDTMVSSESFLIQLVLHREINPMGVSLQSILILYLVLTQHLL